MTALVYFDGQGRWGETLVCERRVRAALRPLGVRWGRGRPPSALAAGARVHRFDADAGLVYLALEDGWAGLLCESGEHVVLPPLRPCHVDGAGPPPAAVAALPRLEAFVEQLLALMGHEQD